jgi:predicted PurR-regulated permease PerM
VDILPGKSLEQTAATEPAGDLANGTATQPGTEPAATASAAAATSPATSPAVAPPDEYSPRTWIAERIIDLRKAGTDFLFSASFVKQASNVASGVFSSTFGVIGNIVIVLFVGLFFAISPSLYSQGIVKLIPVSRRERSAHILSAVGTQLQWWFVAQLGSMLCTGLLTFIGLSILGIPMALTLAIIAALLNFIPNVGPWIAAVPAVLVAFAPHAGHPGFNPALAGWTALLYILVQMNDGWVVTPYLQQRTVSLPPALIIIGQVVFALLLGPVGLVLATPILTTVIALIRMIYIEDILGDRGVETVKTVATAVQAPTTSK